MEARLTPARGRLAGATLLFLFGLVAVPILANYLGSVPAVLLCPLAGALLAAVLGRQALVATVPAALLPAAFLSPRHTGLLLLLLAIVTGAGLIRMGLIRPRG